MIRLCIFDLGGTLVDPYSLSPFLSLKSAFNKKGININDNLIYKDMGMSKYDHIKEILSNKYVCRNWFNKYNKYPDINDQEELYSSFNIIQLNRDIKILPDTKNVINYLNNNNISTGVTTGFSKPIMVNIRDKLISNDIFIDKYVSSTCLDSPGRPFPHMINNIMDKISIEDSNKVIKIDDSSIGIKEGLNAGCITIGVAGLSTNMKIKSYDEKLSKEEYIERLKISREILKSSGSHYVVNSLIEIIPIINKINNI